MNKLRLAIWMKQFLEQQATTAENDDFLDFIRALGTTYLKWRFGNTGTECPVSGGIQRDSESHINVGRNLPIGKVRPSHRLERDHMPTLRKVREQKNYSTGINLLSHIFLSPNHTSFTTSA
jgi:hypothetical protein